MWKLCHTIHTQGGTVGESWNGVGDKAYFRMSFHTIHTCIRFVKVVGWFYMLFHCYISRKALGAVDTLECMVCLVRVVLCNMLLKDAGVAEDLITELVNKVRPFVQCKTSCTLANSMVILTLKLSSSNILWCVSFFCPYWSCFNNCASFKNFCMILYPYLLMSMCPHFRIAQSEVLYQTADQKIVSCTKAQIDQALLDVFSFLLH